MTKAEAMKLVENHNKMIETFMNETLPILLEMSGIKVIVNKKTGEKEIPMTSLVKAYEFVGKMNFYKIGHELQMTIRESGIDCKMNMQNNTLVIY